MKLGAKLKVIKADEAELAAHRAIFGRLRRSLHLAQGSRAVGKRRGGRMKSKNIALIPAAGIGARFGADKPKQYVEIRSKTVLEHTIGISERHEGVDLTVVVVSPEDTFADKVQTAFPQVRVWKNGGQTCAETVRNGVAKLLEIGLASADDNIRTRCRALLPAV